MAPNCIRVVPNWLDWDFTTCMLNAEDVNDENREIYLIGVTYALAVLQRVIRERIILKPKPENPGLIIDLKKELQASQAFLNSSKQWTPKVLEITEKVAGYSVEQCQSMTKRIIAGYKA